MIELDRLLEQIEENGGTDAIATVARDWDIRKMLCEYLEIDEQIIKILSESEE